MGDPGLGPGADRWLGKTEILGVLVERFRIEDAFDRADDGLRGAVGNFQFLFLDHFGFAVVVAGLDFPEETCVAAAPSVDGLLSVADIEKGAGARGILNNFVGERIEDAPLGAAGVLEFIEQPVVVASIEPVIEIPPPRILRAVGEEKGNIGKGERAGFAHGGVIDGLVTRQQGMEGTG